MKTSLYIRVSTQDQQTQNQLLPLRDYCSRMGYQIVDEYIDEGWSGKDAKRPEFERMLADMRAKKFDCIMTWKIDRIGRSLQHLLSFLQELRNRKINFVSITEMIDTSSPHGELLWNIMGAFAQYERSIIISRTMAGLERAKREGKKLGRPRGRLDSKPRIRSGYFIRHMRARVKKSTPHNYAVSHEVVA